VLRRVATALICALLTIIAFTSLAGLDSDPPARARFAADDPSPRSRGHVRAVTSNEPSQLFVNVSLQALELNALRKMLQERKPASAFDSALSRPAFDPELYRAGKVGEPLSRDEICEIVSEVAAEYQLPPPLFTRLIWQESRFRNETVSRAGAQGIAQFMPQTAAERGLEDPFDPLQALPASADFLSELKKQFGNFGLAAAAYNGGPQRVRDWLAGRGRLPKETRDYVLRITGRQVEHWAKASRANPHPDAFDVEDCNVRPIRSARSASGRSRR
jgi:soluble lytic murein transglycosylase-like protein